MCVLIIMLSNIGATVLTCDQLYNHPQVVASFCPKCDRDGDNMRITAYYWGILDQLTFHIEKQRWEMFEKKGVWFAVLMLDVG